MKAIYYEPWATNEERLRHKPPPISNTDWRWLVQFWSSEEAQVRFNITFFLMIIQVSASFLIIMLFLMNLLFIIYLTLYLYIGATEGRWYTT